MSATLLLVMCECGFSTGRLEECTTVEGATITVQCMQCHRKLAEFKLPPKTSKKRDKTHVVRELSEARRLPFDEGSRAHGSHAEVGTYR